MRLQTRLTIAICAGLGLSAIVCVGASLWFSNDMIVESVARRLNAEMTQINVAIRDNASRAVSLARLTAALPPVGDAFAARDRDAVGTLLGPAFAALKSEGVEQLQLHLPPATSFFRAHSPKKFGDDLSAFRTTVVQANRDGRAIQGLETGVAGVGIRGVVPVMHAGSAIGTLEYGIGFGQGFADDLTGRTGARIAIFLTSATGFERLASTFPSPMTFSPDVLAAARDGAQILTAVEIDGKPFTYTFEPLKNYAGDTVGVVAAAVDRSDLEAIATRAHLVFGTAAGLMLVLGVILAWYLQRGIGLPLMTMSSRMSEIAAGNLGVEVPRSSQIHEIRAMGLAVQAFKEAAIEKTRLEASATQVARSIERDREMAAATQAKGAQEQKLVVASLASGLARLSAGDLTCRIEQRFAPDYEKLRADFNGAIAQLDIAMSVVAGNSQGIHVGSDEISHAADDLSRRTEQQAASLAETAATLDEITTAVRSTAAGAEHARLLIEDARTDAERSQTVVGEAVIAMGELSESSRRIHDIVGLVEEIAFQTNILALNAGVEAARAGDAGRGFAVVAQEVRALAQRSTDAAKEIGQLISQSATQVKNGVSLVGQAGDTLLGIATKVTEVSGIVVAIAASAQEQASGLAEVNGAINQMDQVTQQNAAMVEESTAASHSLAQEAARLSALIGRFTVGDAAPQHPLMAA